METTEKAGAKAYPIWKAVFLSFYSKDLYQDVGRNWKGVGFGYLFLILLFLCVPRAIKVHSELPPALMKETKDFLDHVPAFQLEKGVLKVDVKQPFYWPSKAAPQMIIDTTGQVNSLDDVKSSEKEVVLLTRTQMISKRDRLGSPQVETVNFSDFGPLTINRESLTKLVGFFSQWAGPVSYPFLLAFFFVFNIFAVMFYGAIGLLLAKIIGTSLPYDTSMRLAAVSHTPALILAAILAAAGVELPAPVLLFFALSTGYLFWAVKSTAPPPLPA